MIFEGRSRPPVPPSVSAHALHPPVSKSRANVLLIFQCPGICPNPSQVDDSLTLCPTMYNRVFIWPKTRAKSELRVRLVPLDMLFVLLAQISSIVFLNAKNLAFTPNCGVCVVGGGGSRRYNHSNIYHDPAIGYSITCQPVLAGGAVVTNAFHSHNACWYMRALNGTMEMSKDVK